MRHGVSRKQLIRDVGRHDTTDRRRLDMPARISSLRLVLAVVIASAVAVISSTLVLTMLASAPQANTRSEVSTLPLPPLDSPVAAGLPPPSPSTRVPVNPIDRFTGKPIIASSPTVQYKGYVVAFCCPHSTGYRGGWDRLSEAEKDTDIRGFFK